MSIKLIDKVLQLLIVKPKVNDIGARDHAIGNGSLEALYCSALVLHFMLDSVIVN